VFSRWDLIILREREVKHGVYTCNSNYLECGSRMIRWPRQKHKTLAEEKTKTKAERGEVWRQTCSSGRGLFLGQEFKPQYQGWRGGGEIN
jgi:hypothetical protein